MAPSPERPHFTRGDREIALTSVHKFTYQAKDIEANNLQHEEIGFCTRATTPPAKFTVALEPDEHQGGKSYILEDTSAGGTLLLPAMADSKVGETDSLVNPTASGTHAKVHASSSAIHHVEDQIEGASDHSLDRRTQHCEDENRDRPCIACRRKCIGPNLRIAVSRSTFDSKGTAESRPDSAVAFTPASGSRTTISEGEGEHFKGPIHCDWEEFGKSKQSGPSSAQDFSEPPAISVYPPSPKTGNRDHEGVLKGEKDLETSLLAPHTEESTFAAGTVIATGSQAVTEIIFAADDRDQDCHSLQSSSQPLNHHMKNVLSLSLESKERQGGLTNPTQHQATVSESVLLVKHFNLKKTPVGDPTLSPRQNRIEERREWDQLLNPGTRPRMGRNLDELAEAFTDNTKRWCDMVDEQVLQRKRVWEEMSNIESELHSILEKLEHLHLNQGLLRARQIQRLRARPDGSRAVLKEIHEEQRREHHRIRLIREKEYLEAKLRCRQAKLTAMAQQAAQSVRQLTEWDTAPGTVLKRIFQRQKEHELETKHSPLDHNPIAMLQRRKRQPCGAVAMTPAWPQDDYPLPHITHENRLFTVRAVKVPQWFMDLDSTRTVELQSVLENARKIKRECVPQSSQPQSSPREQFEEMWNLLAELQSEMDREEKYGDDTEINRKPWGKEWHNPCPGWATNERRRYGGWWKCRTDSSAPDAELRCGQCQTAARHAEAAGIGNRSAKENYDHLMSLIRDAQAETVQNDILEYEAQMEAQRDEIDAQYRLSTRHFRGAM